MSTLHGWDVYAESLTYLGYGYPLPHPDTRNQDRPWEMEIGDVGWLSDGQFCPLIRTTSTDDAQQPHGRSPEGYVPFDTSKAVIGRNPDRIMERVLHSRKIHATTISAGLSVSASPAEVDAGGNLTFKSSEDRGGLLVLRPKGEETINRSAVLIRKYMRAHFEEWVRFANSDDGLGIGLEPDDIIFVAGVIKTVDWGVAAFLSNQREADGSLSCSFGGIGSANISLSVTNSYPANHWKRAGPSASWRLPARHSPVVANVPPFSTSPPKADQCIFFHYYKLKRRRIFKIPPKFQLKAGAGPHELPRDRGGPGAGSDVLSADSMEVVEDGEAADFEMMPSNHSQRFDPVDAALDYILENSDAEVAIASDMDLYALFEYQDYPCDIARALAEHQPRVVVDGEGVGILWAGAMSEGNTEDGQASGQFYHHTLGPHSTYVADARMEVTPNLPVSLETESIGDTSFAFRRALMQGADFARGLSSDVPNWNDSSTPISQRYSVERSAWDSTTAITALAFSPDGSFLAASSKSGRIRVWRYDATASGDESRFAKIPIQWHDSESLNAAPLVALAFSSDNSKLLGCTDGRTFLAWHMPVAELALVKDDQHASVITFAVFSSDRRSMATGGLESICHVWKLDDGDLLNGGMTLSLSLEEPYGDLITCAAFSNDGTRIVTTSDTSSCRVWSTDTGEELVIWRRRSFGSALSACFSPDGTHVVSCSTNDIVWVWDSFTGDTLHVLHEHHDMVNAVVYSPDGRYIASASCDATVRLWNAVGGECLTVYNEFEGSVTSVLFGPGTSDTVTLASGSLDGTVHIRKLK